MMRRKHSLPAFAELTQIKIDLSRLRAETDKLASEYVNVVQANPALCDNHMDLVGRVYDNFDQINLTELNGEALAYTDNVKERIRRKEERLYNKPTAHYIGSYFEEVVNQFAAPAMRIRITKLKPSSEIPFHIDYDPTYATRVIVPVYSTEKVVNSFKVKNQLQECFLEPGKAYFLNTGYAHAVFNRGDASRIALMFSLDGQEDLRFI